MSVAKRVGRGYLKLVEKFPLTKIKNRAHLDEAAKVIDRLIATDLDRDGREYLDVLTDLVEAYENEHEATPDVPPAEMLRFLMRQNSVTQSQLARHVEIAQSTISALLNGSRQMTAEHMMRLAKYFHVEPSVFIPQTD